MKCTESRVSNDLSESVAVQAEATIRRTESKILELFAGAKHINQVTGSCSVDFGVDDESF